MEGKIVAIVDDMIATGGTICKAADALRSQGAVEVHAAFAPMDYSPEEPSLDYPITLTAYTLHRAFQIGERLSLEGLHLLEVCVKF